MRLREQKLFSLVHPIVTFRYSTAGYNISILSESSLQATYLVPADSKLQSMSDVDSPGVRIVAKARSAYDLWLTENIKNATIIRTKTIDESFKEFTENGYEVLAGLRPKLLDEAAKLPGSRIIDGSFTVIGQSVGCRFKKDYNLRKIFLQLIYRKGLPEAAAFIEQCVLEVRKNGNVDGWIEKYGVTGKLSTPN